MYKGLKEEKTCLHLESLKNETKNIRSTSCNGQFDFFFSESKVRFLTILRTFSRTPNSVKQIAYLVEHAGSGEDLRVGHGLRFTKE